MEKTEISPCIDLYIQNIDIFENFEDYAALLETYKREENMQYKETNIKHEPAVKPNVEL